MRPKIQELHFFPQSIRPRSFLLKGTNLSVNLQVAVCPFNNNLPQKGDYDQLGAMYCCNICAVVLGSVSPNRHFQKPWLPFIIGFLIIVHALPLHPISPRIRSRIDDPPTSASFLQSIIPLLFFFPTPKLFRFRKSTTGLSWVLLGSRIFSVHLWYGSLMSSNSNVGSHSCVALFFGASHNMPKRSSTSLHVFLRGGVLANIPQQLDKLSLDSTFLFLSLYFCCSPWAAVRFSIGAITAIGLFLWSVLLRIFLVRSPFCYSPLSWITSVACGPYWSYFRFIALKYTLPVHIRFQYIDFQCTHSGNCRWNSIVCETIWSQTRRWYRRSSYGNRKRTTHDIHCQLNWTKDIIFPVCVFLRTICTGFGFSLLLSFIKKRDTFTNKSGRTHPLHICHGSLSSQQCPRLLNSTSFLSIPVDDSSFAQLKHPGRLHRWQPSSPPFPSPFYLIISWKNSPTLFKMAHHDHFFGRHPTAWCHQRWSTSVADVPVRSWWYVSDH